MMALVALTASISTAQAETAPDQVAGQVAKLVAEKLPAARTAVYVADARTGEPLVAIGADTLMNPASNVKLISTATALDLLGEDFRYRTRLLGLDPDAAGVVASDLYLLGARDPTLDREDLGALVDDLRATGVTRIAGDLLVGEDAGRDGLGRVVLRVAVRGARPGQRPEVTIEPATRMASVDVKATTTRRAKTSVAVAATPYFDASGEPRVEVAVSGTIRPGARRVRRVVVAQRSIHAAYALEQALLDAGIVVDGRIQVASLHRFLDRTIAAGHAPHVLAEHRSAPLADIVSTINKYSLNWLADRVVLTAAAPRTGGRPSMARAVEAMYGWLERRAGIARDSAIVDSGSGLSYQTRLSARQVVTVLQAGLADETYRSSLAVAGVDGTLRHRMEKLSGRVRGKTGTLRQIVSFAGVVEIDDSRSLLVSIITNDHPRGARRRVRRVHDKLLTYLLVHADELLGPVIEDPGGLEP